MKLETTVWSVMQSLKVDEFIASHTNNKNILRKFIPRSRAYSHEKYEHRINSKLKIILDRADYTQWRIFSGRLSINPNIFNYLKVDSENFSMIDIGANIGGVSILMADKINVKNFSIHLFEPNPNLLPVLEENIKRLGDSNSAVNAVVNQLAVGDKNTTLPLQIRADHTGLATLAHTSNSFENSVDVKVILLDDYVNEHKIDRLDFLKIDVESYEPGVLKGALKTIHRFRPVLYMEYSSEWFENFDKEYIESLFADINSIGYKFYREGRDGSLNPLPLTQSALQEYTHLNILAAYSKK
jgi:FkbM family methyltransferase